MLITTITSEDQLRRFVPECNRLFADYLRRSKEPFTVEHLWAAIRLGLATGTLLFLLALDDRIRPIGYLLAQPGRDFWGVEYVNVLQLYVAPGQRDVAQHLDLHLKAWTQARGAAATTAVTMRHPNAFTRFVARYGFRPYAAMFVRLEETNGQGEAATDSVAKPDSE